MITSAIWPAIILLLAVPTWAAEDKSVKTPEQAAQVKEAKVDQKADSDRAPQKQEKTGKTSEQPSPVKEPIQSDTKAPAEGKSTSEPNKITSIPELSIVGKDVEKTPTADKDGKKEPEKLRLKMGEILTIKAAGDYAKTIRGELEKVAASRALVLYLDGVRMANLTVSPAQVKGGGDLLLGFHLSRNSHDDENRKAWDTFLTKQSKFVMTPAVALGLGNNIPWTVSASGLEFYIAQTQTITITFIVGVVIFLVAFYQLVKNPTALRDSKDGFYSLGKSQMAFWGLIVVLAFGAVWIVTGTMERIPAQVLILLGISGATGLSAVVIGENKKAIKESESQSAITKLREEQHKLEKEKISAPAVFPQTSEERLVTIHEELAALSQQVSSVELGRFWKDICDDGNGGMSFHRLQVVIWTLVLGVVFVWSIAQVMSMPEFPETLLVLMGISNGFYLGFKIPEKQ